MTPPESVTPRCWHSITATSLGPGLTEVLVFGGQQTFRGNSIADTTILRFGEQLLVCTCSHGNTLSDRHNTCVNDSECIYCYMCSLIPPTELTGPSASDAGPSAGKWALVDVAHNDTRGSAQRLREKRIIQATARASSFSETSDHSSQDRVRALEQQLRAAEQRCSDTQVATNFNWLHKLEN